MQTIDDMRNGQAKASDPTTNLLFLALNDFEEFERRVLGRLQDPTDHGAQPVKSTYSAPLLKA